MANVRAIYGDRLVYGSHPDGCAGRVPMPWQSIRNGANFATQTSPKCGNACELAVIFDGRNLYDPDHMADSRIHLLFDRTSDGGTSANALLPNRWPRVTV